MHCPLVAPKLDNPRSLSNVAIANSQADAQVGLLYPDFLRKRATPGRHMVVPHEVDHSLLMECDRERRGIDGIGDIGALLKLRNDKHDEKEETWNKLTELSMFALSVSVSLRRISVRARTIARRKLSFCVRVRLIRTGCGITDFGCLSQHGLPTDVLR